MPTVTLDGFKRGVDLTRPAYAADTRSLAVALNAHLTRGGDVEQRYAFVPTHTLPEGTVGLADVNGQLLTFGEAADAPAGMPAGVQYLALPHPTHSALSAVLDVELFGGKPYVVARYADGSVLHFYDGQQLEDWFDGKARCSFFVTTGSEGAANTVSAVLVNGINLLAAPVAWTTSHSATAAAVAAAISGQPHGYKAEAQGQQVIITAAVAGTAANAHTLTVTPAGNVAVSLITKMEGGTDGTFNPGPAALTYGSKMYSVSGPYLHFSDLFDPLTVQPSSNGAGFVDLSTDSAGAEELVGLAPYYSVMAIFARNTVQVWSVDVDDTENQRLQTVSEVGLVSTRAIQPWRDGSVLFLSRMGVKALTSRDSSGRAGVDDFSLSIDPDLVPHMTAADPALLDRAMMLREPQDGRLWVILGDRIFVYTEFTKEQVAGWSEYRPGLTFTDYAISNHRIYLRAGDQLYLYGGTDGLQFDAAPVTVRLPFLGGGQGASSFKRVSGIDVGAEGRWQISILPDYRKPTTKEPIGQIDGPTFDQPLVGVVSWSSHFAFEFTRAQASRGTLSSVHIHASGDATK